MSDFRLKQARNALAVAKAYQPIDDRDRRRTAQNIAQIERYIAQLDTTTDATPEPA